MMDLYSISIGDIKTGFCYSPETDRYTCAYCGAEFESGEVYPSGGRFYDARRMAEKHVREGHGGSFGVLLAMDKKETGLTDTQKELLLLMYGGSGDREIAEKTGVALSTVRHQRFMFREKMRQAKVFLAVCELALENRRSGSSANGGEELAEIHRGATMVDERYLVTKAEEEQIISNMFSSIVPLKLRHLSPKEKKKIVILRKISGQFDRSRRYSEKELNAILKDIYEDFATLRRYLIEYGFMDRTPDGKEYWRKP